MGVGIEELDSSDPSIPVDLLGQTGRQIPSEAAAAEVIEERQSVGDGFAPVHFRIIGEVEEAAQVAESVNVGGVGDGGPDDEGGIGGAADGSGGDGGGEGAVVVQHGEHPFNWIVY